MRHRLAPFRKLPFYLALFATLLGTALSALGEIDRVVDAPSFDRDFILDGDSISPERDGVAVTMEATISADSEAEWADYRFAWELEVRNPDGSWSRVPLSGSDVYYTSDETVLIDDDPDTDNDSSQTVEKSEEMTPESVLNPYKTYRVRGQLQRQEPNFGFGDPNPFEDVESPATGGTSNLYQFTNATSGDDARNIITTLDAVNLSNPFLLDDASDAAKRGFTINVESTARRWDEFEDPIESTQVTFEYTVELREKGSGDSVPLEQNTFAKTHSIDSYFDLFTDPVPRIQSIANTLTLVPSGQLDPVNKQYEVDVSVAHLENPVTDTFAQGNEKGVADLRLFDFNGQLSFGGRTTRLKDFTRSPQPATTDGANYVEMTLEGVGGHLDGRSGYTFNAPSSVDVRLFADGSAVVQDVAANIPVTPPGTPDTGTAANVRFTRENTELRTNGLYSDLTVRLPQGMGFVPPGGKNRNLRGELPLPGRELDDQLTPFQKTHKFTPPSPVRVLEETKPSYVAAEQIIWDVNSGDFTLQHPSNDAGYVRDAEADFLQAAPVPEEDRTKPDNSAYYHALSGARGGNSRISTDEVGAARMTAAYDLAAGQLVTHFPRGSRIEFSGGGVSISEDSIAAGDLQLSSSITLTYDQTCSGDDCGTGEQNGAFTIDPGELSLTADGGFVGEGALLDNAVGDRELSWGYIEALSSAGDPVYAQSLGDFTNAIFHATGHFIRGEGGDAGAFNPGGAGDTAARNGPAETLLAAVEGPSGSDALNMARPGSTADQDGDYYYAGINLEAESDGNITGIANIAGEPVGYDLRGCGKFYVRQVGVTGTLEAVPDSFPDSPELYGYEFSFDYYGLGYLDSDTSPRRSFTEGSVDTPFPVDSTFAFDGLSFTCLGGLDNARLPEGGLEKEFAYWRANIDVSALTFTSSNSCDPSADAFLTLGATGYSTLVDQPLHGTVGVRPNGRLIHREFSDNRNLETEITSRFRLPNNLRLKGPENEKYDLATVSEAYLNNFAQTSEQDAGDGRLNFATKIDVPFFEDLAAHVRTTASKNTNPDAVVDLMGGWSENGQTFFSTSFFDTVNRGFPDGVSEALYRNESGASGDPRPYLVTARQSWLNVVDLEYPLQWSSSLRTFSAFEPEQQEDLLIVEVDHQLEYLSAENAEISFGAQYEGLPRINLTNFVFNKIDKKTGALQAATDALRGEAVDALDQGISSMDELLEDRIDALLEEFVGKTVDPIIDKLYDQLDTAAQATNSVNTWKNEVGDAADTFILNNAQNPSDNLRHAIKNLGKNVDEASSVIHRVDQALLDVQIALRSVHDRIYLKDGKVQLDPPQSPDPEVLNGLLSEEDGEFQIVQTLIARLIAEVGDELGPRLENMLNDSLSGPTGELEQLINEQLEKVRPTLERVRNVIAQLDQRIGDIRSEIENGTKLVDEFQNILDAADSQIDTATTDLRSTVEDFILADIPGPDRFTEYTREELKQRVRSEIKDKIRGMAFVREFQQVLRQHLYDIDLEIKEGIDSAFAQVNKGLKNLLKSYLADFDESINGVLGDINSVVGAGQFDGYAHINGDALRLLRIDASLRMKVPKDMEYEGYFQIKQLASDGTGSCSYSAAGTPAKEITLGTPGVPVEWLSPGMEIAVEGKVTYSDKPLGLGGKIEMVDGSFNFEAFEVTDLGAAMSFGKTENYLAAKVGLRFQSYDIYGGVFFGQTCTIEPVELVNDEAAGVIGEPDPTFTGAYVYGEAHIPVTEAVFGIPATCMFRIDAGVGAGAFVFAEGPTFGGQILLAISGEALCLVGVNGEVSMIGAKVGEDLRYRGRGTIGGRVGSCPFCVKFSKSVILKYRNDRWKVQL